MGWRSFQLVKLDLRLPLAPQGRSSGLAYDDLIDLWTVEDLFLKERVGQSMQGRYVLLNEIPGPFITLGHNGSHLTSISRAVSSL